MNIPLHITIPEGQWFIPETNEFVYSKKVDIVLNHTLNTIARWESIWTKSFFASAEKSDDELVSYIRCMSDVTIDDMQMAALTNDNLLAIREYLEKSYSALEFFKSNSNSKETITSEYIFYWMFSYNIPIECADWHISRLMSLIELFSVKNSDGKDDVPVEDLYARNKELNEARKAKYKTTG